MKEIDLLVGAAKIAEEFDLTERQVYNLRYSGKAPIKNTPGLGLTTSKSALKAYLCGQYTQANASP